MTTTTGTATTTTPLPASFLAWLAAATVADLGGGVLFFAISWTAAGHGGRTAGLLLTLVVLPRTLLMLVGGAVGDRFGLRRTVIGCDVVTCLALAGYLVTAGTSAPSVIALAGLALTIGTVSAFRLPASGTLPRLFVTDDRLPHAMSLTGSLLQVARLAGPPAGGVVVAALGMAGALGANLVTAVVILLVLLTVRPPYEQPPARHEGSAVRRIAEGLAAARRVPGNLALLGSVMLVAASVIPVLSLCVPLAARERGWSVTATGFVEAAWIVGTLSVTVLVARTGTWRRPLWPLTAGPLLAGLGILALLVSPTPEPAMAGAAVMGVGTALFTTHLFPLYVLRTPDGMLARFQALLGVVQAVALLIATGTYGLLAGAGTPAPALLAAASLTVLAALCVVSSAPLRDAG